MNTVFLSIPKRHLRSWIILCLLGCTTTVWAFDIVSDPAAEAHLAEELNDWQKQASQMQNQLTTLQHQYTELQQSTANVATPTFSTTTHLMNQLASLISEQNQVAYNAQGLNAYFQKNFPGYQAPSDYQRQYQRNAQQTLTLLNNALQGLNLSASDFLHENTRLQAIQAQAGQVQGQTQALQAIAEISSEMVSQVQLLRQTLMSQTNSQAVYEATQLQTEASKEAELASVIQKGCQEVKRCEAAGVAPNHSLKEE